MPIQTEHQRSIARSGKDKKTMPGDRGGDAARQAQRWGGGSKGSKGRITRTDKRNPNSSAKS